VLLTVDGRHVFRIGSGNTGITDDGEMVFGLPNEASEFNASWVRSNFVLGAGGVY